MALCHASDGVSLTKLMLYEYCTRVHYIRCLLKEVREFLISDICQTKVLYSEELLYLSLTDNVMR